ncbi:MAG: GNAT family protein [Candidatus Thorarchaeota archaeon]
MESQKVRLKDDRDITLRLLEIGDRDQLLNLFSKMSKKALEWGMPPYTKEIIDRWISNIEKLIPLVAIFDEEIVGYTTIFKHMHPREMGVGDMGIYLHQDFHGIGLGTIMTKIALSLAKEQGLHRIGLHVVEENRAAVNLYRKLGFIIEGTMRDAYFGQDGHYHNLLVMGILFPKN